MRFESIVHSLRAWFAERDIPLNGLTLIINMQNKDQAARFDFELNREFGEHTWVPPNFYVDIRKFTLEGVAIKVESPLHESDLYRFDI